jgi:ABC-type Fe3+-siderophore transport system permease subunit
MKDRVRVNKTVSSGIGFGCALAITISWSANKSILWAMLHGSFSWFYVVYYALKY